MELDKDGYFVAPPLKQDTPPQRKGVKCGKCAMKFDDNKPYGYCCPHLDCPVFFKARF